MKINLFTVLIFSIGIVLWSDLAESKTCRDEPERCPVIRWSCSQAVPKNTPSYTYFSAKITSSLFDGDSLTVTENHCVQSSQLNCQQRNNQGWILYPQVPQGQLVSQVTGQRVIVNCNEYENLP